ncbi:MAG: GNAT family N-acetyltransferase [bacterium]|nr:GNAT family N-acetyltransferase [bacterium]
MKLQLSNDFELIKEKYIEVIEHTEHMEEHARWVYGQHPTDELLKGYMERNEMYTYMDGDKVAGIVAITMYQGDDYEPVPWEIPLKKDEVASLHILTVCPEYQGKGVARKMILDIIEHAKKNGKKAVRLDTLATNIPAQHMYESIGFQYRGKQNLYAKNTGWTDFLYYEKILLRNEGGV